MPQRSVTAKRSPALRDEAVPTASVKVTVDASSATTRFSGASSRTLREPGHADPAEANKQRALSGAAGRDVIPRMRENARGRADHAGLRRGRCQPGAA